VLDGRFPDHPPVSFWHHFRSDQIFGPAAIRAHVEHLHTYDLDFLKVMNDNPYPHLGRIQATRDLSTIAELRGDEPEFARQLQLLADLRRTLGDEVVMTTTVFNAWAVLRHLIRPPTEHNPPDLSGGADEPSNVINAMLAEDEKPVKSALNRIGMSLSRFARRCIDAGADGIFLSVRDDWVASGPQDHGRYDDLLRPSDLQILNSASSGTFNMLHVCGRAVDFRAFADYPVHAINWADRSAGPSIADVKDWLKPAICAGIDNLSTLPDGTPDEVEREVADALRQAGDRPIMIAPGCTYDPHRVPPANLHAVVQAGRGLR
jgi:uroporphyrinogen decarboxylase